MKIHCCAALVLLLIFAPLLVGAVPITLLDTDAAGFVGQAARGPLDQPTLVTSYEEFAAIFGASTDGLTNPFLAPSVAGFFANGGQRLWIVRVASANPLDLVGLDGGGPGTRTGLQTLIDIDAVAMVAIPGATAPLVQTAMIAHCRTMHDRLAILDPASIDDLQAVLAQRALLDAADGHATLYFPWIEAAPAGDSLLMPPSGLVAGIYASAAPPDSPVGGIATATNVSYDLSGDEQEILNPLGINAIRRFGAGDVRVWGARTLASDPEWRYVAVRRTALCLEESIDEGTAWAVFEPNDEPLWAQLRLDVEYFLADRWLAGWFAGATPDDAFFVRCDTSTMTEADLAAGRTIVLVGFAPLAPAEFMLLRIVHQRPPNGVPDGREAPRLTASPNPFNPRTVIAFDLPQDGPVSLRIHDLAGRLVRELVRAEVMVAGEHQRSWDGRDSAGADLAAGVYLVQIRTGGVERTRSITLVR